MMPPDSRPGLTSATDSAQNDRDMDTARGRLRRFGLAAAVVVGLALAVPGCRWFDNLDDELKTCHDWDVRLLNDEQTIDAVHIIGPNEGVRSDTLLDSGKSRTIVLCLDPGHDYNFRVESEDGRILAAIKCPVSSRHYDGITPTVAWTPIGLRCIDW